MRMGDNVANFEHRSPPPVPNTLVIRNGCNFILNCEDYTIPSVEFFLHMVPFFSDHSTICIGFTLFKKASNSLLRERKTTHELRQDSRSISQQIRRLCT